MTTTTHTAVTSNAGNHSCTCGTEFRQTWHLDRHLAITKAAAAGIAKDDVVKIGKGANIWIVVGIETDGMTARLHAASRDLDGAYTRSRWLAGSVNQKTVLIERLRKIGSAA